MDWVNGHHIRNYDIDRLTELVIPYLKEANLIDDKFVEERFDWIKTLVETVRESLSNISEIVDKADIFSNNEVEPENEEALSILKQNHVPSLLSAFKQELDNVEEVDEEFAKTIMKKIQKNTGIKGKKLFMPTRVALTGNVHGPELVSIIYLLGKQNILSRIEYVKERYL